MRGAGLLLGTIGLALSGFTAAALLRDAPSPGAPPQANVAVAAETTGTDLQDYRWPTDETRVITSSFGEFRSTHFHAGIDISTRDRVGARVLAARDGFVLRVRVSPTGYGKMVYLRHRDGYTTTYAHLDRFSPALEERVRAEQLRRGTYPVTLRFHPGQIPVRRGELIAYSGETGSGTPHLHFEIRDRHGEAVNPMLCPDFRILDSIPPGPRRLVFVPLGPASAVNGKTEPSFVSIRQQRSGTYQLDKPVSISGSAGIALYIRDRSNGTWFRHGIYRHTLSVNGRPLLRVRFDRVPMDEDQQIGLYYHWELYQRHKGRFQKLYIDRGHRLSLYSPDSVGAGVLSPESVPEGRAEIRIETSDYNGNGTTIIGDLIVSRPPSIAVRNDGDSLHLAFDSAGETRWIFLSTMSPGSKSWRLSERLPVGAQGGLSLPFPAARQNALRIVAENAEGFQSDPWFFLADPASARRGTIRLELKPEDSFVRAVVTTAGTLTGSPRLHLQEGTHERVVSLTRVELGRAEGWFIPDATYGGLRVIRAEADVGTQHSADVASLELYPLVPGRADTYLIDGGRFRISSLPESVYDTLWVSIDRNQTAEGNRTYRLGPSHAVLRKGITVAMERDQSTTGDLYVRGRGSWTLLARALQQEVPVMGRLRRSLGELTLLEDTRGPAVGKLSVSSTSGRKIRFSFAYDDDLSGVDYDSLKTYIDGTIVIPEIDGEHHRVHYLSRDPRERGPHQLTIRLRDNVGNLTTVERRVFVP